MRTQYLVPCACGKELPVDGSQAGQTVVCSCGAAVEVPTMRGLRGLPTIEASTVDDAPYEIDWRPRHGVMLLGALIFVAALAPAIYLFFKLPERPVLDPVPTLQAIDVAIDKMTLPETWKFYKQNVVEKEDLIVYPQRPIQQYEFVRANLFKWIGIALAVSFLGAALFAGGLARHMSLRKSSPRA